MKKTLLLLILFSLLAANMILVTLDDNTVVGYDFESSDTVTLRPDDNGTYSECTANGDTYNWQCVNEATADNDTTYVDAPNGVLKRDTHSMENQTAVANSEIDNVTMYFTVRQTLGGSTNCRILIYSGGSLYQQEPDVSVYQYYVEYSYTWETDPGNSSNPWTWGDINDLEIGYQLWTIPGMNSIPRCTQVYAIVAYTVSTSVNNYVNLYPGANFYGDYQTISIADDTTINCSYFFPGDNYFLIDVMNFTKSSNDRCDYNLSFYNDTYEIFNDRHRFLEFNATYNPAGSESFMITLPEDYFLVDMYVDDALVCNGITESGGVYTFPLSSSEEYTFYIDGYQPDCPTSGDGYYSCLNNTINLTWVGSENADTYVLVSKLTGYPSSVTDGTVVQNSSKTYYNTTTPGTIYYSVWAYNNSGFYSPDNCKLDLLWGGMRIRVYNESKPTSPVSPFGLLITNSTGEDAYYVRSATNPHCIDYADIPYGDDTIIIINATVNGTGYKDRTYYKDLVANQFYNYTFYLPPIITEEADETRLYRIRVIDEYTYPLADVEAIIKRYINETDTYEEVGSIVTDGYGEADINLIPEAHYKVFLTKTDYEQVGSTDWIPDPVWYGANYPKTFQMQQVVPDIEERTFWDIIQFNATLFINGSIHVFYDDTVTSTTNATFHTNSIFNFTRTLIDTDTTVLDTFSYWVTGSNASREHHIIIHLNHTILGWVNVTIILNPVYSPEYEKSDIETKSVAVFGVFTLGYVNFFLIFIPMIILLIVFGPRHTGLGIIGAGLYMGFTSIFIDTPQELLLLVPFIVAIGIIYIIVKEGGAKL